MTALQLIMNELKSLPQDKLEEAASFIHFLKEEVAMHPEWEAVIDRRAKEMQEGKVDAISAEEVHAQVKEKLKNARQISS